MSTITPPADPEADPRVRAVFDDIRATRNTDFINNMWRYLAFDPALLEQTWAEVKRVMATPSSLDPLTKELIYTGITRAKKICVLIGTSKALAYAIKNMTVLKRNTKLKERINPSLTVVNVNKAIPLENTNYEIEKESSLGMVAEEKTPYGDK